MTKLRNENDYILAFAGILERMAADGYTYDEVEEVFETAVDEVGLFDEIDDWDDDEYYEGTE